MNNYDFLIIGAGVFGLTAAIELVMRGYTVAIINPDTIPHPLAASTDISKAVRMEYGSDKEYFEMAEICIERWEEWNDFFDMELYHEVGFLMLCKKALNSEYQAFEKHSYQNLIDAGYSPQRLDAGAIIKQYPVINEGVYQEACFNPRAGYVESGLVITTLANYALELGVDIYEGCTARSFIIHSGRLVGVQTREGENFHCAQAIVCAGAQTPSLVPELQPYIKITGHPVFHLRPTQPKLFQAPHFTVFTADISHTGWYGFPFSPRKGVVKIARHSNGLLLDPDKDDRRVTDREVQECRDFLAESFPILAEAPMVYTRRCLYTDTLDGHFWIDHHPEIEGLAVSSGGSGHGMKMAPILGEITADMAERKAHPLAARFRWRDLNPDTIQSEEARFVENRRL